MGKLLEFLLVAAAFWSFACNSASCREMPPMDGQFIASDGGRAVADIVIPSKALPIERFSAEELQLHLGKAFGRKPEIVEEGEIARSAASSHFFIGATDASARHGMRSLVLARDEHLVKIVGNACYLLGNDSTNCLADITSQWDSVSRGTLYAVYDFLENEIGVLWLWPGETGMYVPRHPSMVLGPTDRRASEPMMDRRFAVAPVDGEFGFVLQESRKKFFREQKLFLLRHRAGRNRFATMGHSFRDYWKRFGESHSEYFALLPNGLRMPVKNGETVSMCVSEPGLWKQKVADWRRLRKYEMSRGWDPLPWVNCCENDGPGMCVCRKCRSWDGPDPRFAQCPYWNGSYDGARFTKRVEELGPDGAIDSWLTLNKWVIFDPAKRIVPSTSDRYARFFNEVLAEVRKLDPGARVVGHAYMNYLEPPLKTVVDPGVVIIYVPRTFFPYDQAESDCFRKEWSGWRKAGARDLIYRPNYTLAGGNFPIDNGRRILSDFSFAYTNGMVACFFDSMTGSWSAHAMMNYALTRSFRDPLYGYERARREMVRAFGTAGPAVDRYLQDVEDHTSRCSAVDYLKMANANVTKGLPGGSFLNAAAILGDFFDDSFFVRTANILDEARSAAGGDSEVVSRIDFLAKGLRDAELTRRCRVVQKRVEAGIERQSAFEAAFAELAAYRQSVEADGVGNYQHQAKSESLWLGWPHHKHTTGKKEK